MEFKTSWSKIIGGSERDTLSSTDIASNGDLYISGYSGPSSQSESFLARYDSNGANKWTTILIDEKFGASPSIAEHQDKSIFALHSGNLSKLSTQNGEILWQQEIFKPKISPYYNSIETSASGDVYAAYTAINYSTQSIYDPFNAFITKYNGDGTIAWTDAIGGEDRTEAVGVDISSAESAIIAGNKDYDGFISKYDKDGVQQWIKFHNDAGSDALYHDVSVDKSGNIYIIGNASGPTLDGHEISKGEGNFLSKFNPNGDKEWTYILDGFTTYNTLRGSVSVTPLQDILISARGTHINRYVASFSTKGELQWKHDIPNAGMYFPEETIAISKDKDSFYFASNTTEPIGNQKFKGGSTDILFSLYTKNGSTPASLPAPKSEEINIAKNTIIKLPGEFNKKSLDKITNFNPRIDSLEIDADSFSIGSSATFAAGKNKKEVKKKLTKQDFDFLYDQKKGGLYFNENGSDKGYGDGGIIAILKGGPELTSSNLEFI